MIGHFRAVLGDLRAKHGDFPPWSAGTWSSTVWASVSRVFALKAALVVTAEAVACADDAGRDLWEIRLRVANCAQCAAGIEGRCYSNSVMKNEAWQTFNVGSPYGARQAAPSCSRET